METNKTHYIISNYEISKSIGEILETIEAIGLPEKQEEALKNIVRKKITNLYTTDYQIELNNEIGKNPLDNALLCNYSISGKPQFFISKYDKDYKPWYETSEGKII
jgi:hypothetical protein